MKLKQTILHILAVAAISYVVASYVHQDRRFIKPEMFILYGSPKSEAIMRELIPLGTDVNVFRVAMTLSGMEEIEATTKPQNNEATGKAIFRLVHSAWWHIWGVYWVWVIAQYDENGKIVEINVSPISQGL